MNPVIGEMFETLQVKDEAGNTYPFHSGISLQQGLFLQGLIEDCGASQTLETGCAYGASALFICEALAKKAGSKRHIAIDPVQSTHWNNIGVANIKRAGYAFFEHIEQGSELALPGLLSKGERFDFAFLDGWHTFDHSLVDFFYCDRLINPGGIIALHDVQMPSLKKLAAYISQFSNYTIAAEYKNPFDWTEILAMKKLREEKRDWDWFKPF